MGLYNEEKKKRDPGLLFSTLVVFAVLALVAWGISNLVTLNKGHGSIFSVLVLVGVAAMIIWSISKWLLQDSKEKIEFQGTTTGSTVDKAGMLSNWLEGLDENSLVFQISKSISIAVGTVGWTMLKLFGDTFGILSNWLEGLDENSLLFQRSKSISIAVGTVVGWTMLKLFGGKFRGATLLALVIALATGGGISKWLRSFGRREKEEEKSIYVNFLGGRFSGRAGWLGFEGDIKFG